MNITFKNRSFETEPLAENVVKHVTRSGKTNYYIKEKTTGQWKYSHETRFNGLIKRFGSVEAISDRYLTPVDIAVISLQEDHKYRYLLDKQPTATRKRVTKKEQEAKTLDPRVDSVATPAPSDVETKVVASV
jgi:hypothetical protein